MTGFRLWRLTEEGVSSICVSIRKFFPIVANDITLITVSSDGVDVQ